VTGHLDRTALRRTNWLKHLTNILDGILVITRTIHLSNSHVLVHCSDGWDRTSQLSSIAQLCLDPYYRTAQGFAVLIEKDWLSYGHKFSDRTGHLCGDKTEFINQSNDTVSAQSSFLASVQKQFSGSSHAFKETCPVFQQFLDCIYQIQRQFPNRFEWNELLLRRLQEEIYAISSGSFLWNSEREREQMNGRSRTMSIWEEVFEAEEHDGKLVLRKEFVNVDYDPKLDDPESRGLDSDQGVLLVEPLNVRWWFELFGREDDEMNGKEIASKEEDVEDIAIIIEGLGDDVSVSSLSPEKPTTPVAAPVPRTAQPVSRSLASVNSSSSRSSSPSNSSTSNLPSQVQLADAVSSVQKFGWGAWKSVQKGYQEAVTTYRDSPLRPASIDADLTQSYAASPTPVHIVPVTRPIQADNIASNPWEQHTAEAIDRSTSSSNPTLFSSPTIIAPITVLPNATTPVILRETQSHIGEVKAVEDGGSDPLGVGL
jgi:myotubularin-related protein 6/7/8